MTGSSLAPVVIPIVVAISLAAWIFMVFYADSHPGWRGQATTSKQPRTGASAAGRRPELSRRQATPATQADEPMTRPPHRVDQQETPRAA